MEIHPFASYIKYLIEDCYEEDYDPLFAEFWYDNYSYHYTFMKWYFLYRKKIKNNKYKLTPEELIIGSNIFNFIKLK